MAGEKIKKVIVIKNWKKPKSEPRIYIFLSENFGDKVRESDMTRQEAIERIAKAICADDVMREGYYQLAEAALNALLEE